MEILGWFLLAAACAYVVYVLLLTASILCKRSHMPPLTTPEKVWAKQMARIGELQHTWPTEPKRFTVEQICGYFDVPPPNPCDHVTPEGPLTIKLCEKCGHAIWSGEPK